jgi:hypothetical protein
VSSADAAIASGNLGEAQRNLDKAAHLIRNGAPKVPGLDYSYGQLWDKVAARTPDKAQKAKLLQKAVQAYTKFAKTGTGSRVQRANARAAELAEEIKELGP